MIITPINFIIGQRLQYRQTQPARVNFCAAKSDTFTLSDEYEKNRKASDKFFEITDLNQYYSNFDRDNIDRIYRLDVWKENLKKFYLEKNPVLSLKIFESLTTPLTKENHEQPPIFNLRTLRHTLGYMKEKNFENFHSSFRKIYQSTLRHYVISGNCQAGELDTTWVKIPSKKSDSENFKTNLEKLKILSSRRWCTKATHARVYLETDDCYIYYDKGKPKIIINAEGNQLKNLQCGSNNSFISFKYADIIEEFLQSQGLTADRNNLMLLKKAKLTGEKVKNLKEELAIAIAENNQEQIFNTFGISIKKTGDGTYSISHYVQPDDCFTYKDIGIDENLLLKNISEIEGCADFIHSNATILNDLRKIGKDANFMYSKIKSLNNLEYIGGLANFLRMPNLKTLPNLAFVGMKLAITRDIDLPKLTKTCVLYF